MANARVDTFQMDEKPKAARDRVLSEVVPSLTVNGGYTLIAQDTQTLTLTKKYRPTWATVLAVLGVLFFLIGLLFLLVKETQTIILSFSPSGKGTRVMVTGARDGTFQYAMTTKVGAQVVEPAGLTSDEG